MDVLILGYVAVGILLFAAYPNAGTAFKVSFALFFPIHLLVLSYLRACVTHDGEAADNPIWFLLLFLFLWLLLSS